MHLIGKTYLGVIVGSPEILSQVSGLCGGVDVDFGMHSAR